MITKLAISGYRSLRDVTLALDRLNVDAIADAFPDSAIEIRTVDGYFELEMRQHGCFVR